MSQIGNEFERLPAISHGLNRQTVDFKIPKLTQKLLFPNGIFAPGSLSIDAGCLRLF
jgi:hypothetical protein